METNKVFLTGYIGNDVQSDSTERKIVRFTLLTKEPVTSKKGEQYLSMQWHMITAHDEIADMACSSLQRGSYVFVEGRLTTRIYTDPDGSPRYIVTVTAQKITVL